MPDDKVKIYKNPARDNNDAPKPYVPQYQINGVEPGKYKGAMVPGNVQIARPSAVNPRIKNKETNVPYAVAAQSPVGRGRGPVPNVGNNMEHTWSLSDEIIDDLSSEIDLNHTMVDNNDYLSEDYFPSQNGITAADIGSNTKYGTVKIEVEPEKNTNAQLSKNNDESNKDILLILQDLMEDNYLLIVSGEPVCSGPKDEIEEQAKALVFGEHEMCDGNPVSVDDILIIKKAKVKVGLFLE